MITVRINAELVGEVFLTGYRLPDGVSVWNGLPKGAQLLRASVDRVDMKLNHWQLLLFFSDPDHGPDRDVDIIFRQEANPHV
jgi:hypothetical protein